MRFSSLEKAFDCLSNSHHIVTSMAAAEPTMFFSHLHLFLNQQSQLTIRCANPTQDYPCFSLEKLPGKCELEVMFLTKSVMREQGKNRVHYVPQHLSQWVENILLQGPVDIFWGSCSPADENGFVTLGLGCCYESEILKQAKYVILEVNEKMPKTFGQTRVAVSQVTHFLDNTHELPTLIHSGFSAQDHQISQYVSSLIPDESTIQLGIGGIPDALVESLKSKQNLGIHTEIMTESAMKLMQLGIATNAKKSIHPGKTICSFIFGSTKLYDFVHNNPNVELYPSSYVNSALTLSQNHNMISINTALEVDLTGQVCSESIGHQEISGVGGAFDTHVGAQRSAGGRGIIALRSCATDLSYSKIVFELRPGAKVSIPRNDIDTVVTEFGVAHLKGQSVAQRAQALIAIAHPNFREQLTSQAKAVGYI